MGTGYGLARWIWLVRKLTATYIYNLWCGTFSLDAFDAVAVKHSPVYICNCICNWNYCLFVLHASSGIDAFGHRNPLHSACVAVLANSTSLWLLILFTTQKQHGLRLTTAILSTERKKIMPDSAWICKASMYRGSFKPISNWCAHFSVSWFSTYFGPSQFCQLFS